MLKKLCLTAGSLLLMTLSTAGQAADADPANTLYMRLSTGGTATIALKPDLAPNHVEQIKALTGEGFYDGIVFHRVIEGFMAQAGDPSGTGTGGSDKPDLKAEFSDTDYVRGTVGMARTSNPDSANSQFFICFTDTGCSFLKGQYTVVGQVVDGMEFVDKLARGEPPASPDKIEKMIIAADAKADMSASSEEAAEPAEASPSEAIEAASETQPAAGEEASEAAASPEEDQSVEAEMDADAEMDAEKAAE